MCIVGPLCVPLFSDKEDWVDGCFKTGVHKHRTEYKDSGRG